MKLTTTKKGNLTLNIVSGSFSADDVIAALDRFYSGEPTPHVLWDFSNADFDEITSDDVRRMSEFSRMHEAKRAHGKTALVFSADVGYGLGRMFGTLQEVDESPVQHRSFRTMEEAMVWLRGGKEKGSAS